MTEIGPPSSYREMKASVVVPDKERRLSVMSGRSNSGGFRTTTRPICSLVSHIRYLKLQLDGGDLLPSQVQEEVTSVESQLADFDQQKPGSGATKKGLRLFYHQQAFVEAARIYLYRQLQDAWPRDVRKYVRNVFEYALGFTAAGGRCFPLWPALMAAAEATEAPDQAMVSMWIEDQRSLTWDSRVQLEALVLEIWRIRMELTHESGTPSDMIKLDWKQVKSDLLLDFTLF